jgi:8-oxo-dGTP diphosphatase
MGGFVMLGETVEQTVRRELKEEMTIELQDTPFLFGVYSDPRRDNRRHTVSAVYVVRLDGTEQPKAADDIKGVVRIPMDDIEKYDYFSDHKTILTDYLQIIRKEEFGKEPVSDFANDIVRSVCPIDSTAVLNTNAKSVYR